MELSLVFGVRLERSQPPAVAAQQAAEGFPEGHVTQSVAAGVDCTVDVTEPTPHPPQDGGDTEVTEGGDDGHDVIGCPGEDEGQEDGKDGLGDLPLSRHHSPFPSLLRLETGEGGEHGGGSPVDVCVG